MFEPMTENEAGLSGGFNGQKTKKKKDIFKRTTVTIHPGVL